MIRWLLSISKVSSVGLVKSVEIIKGDLRFSARQHLSHCSERVLLRVRTLPQPKTRNGSSVPRPSIRHSRPPTDLSR